MADAFVLQSKDFGYALQIDPPDTKLSWVTPPLGTKATIADFGSSTPPEPLIQLAYGNRPNSNPGYGIHVVYPGRGPNLAVSGLGRAAQHRNTTPWLLLPAGDRRENFVYPPPDPLPKPPIRINYVTVIPTTERKDEVLNWEFYAATSPITAVPGFGPVGTLEVVSSNGKTPVITVVTQLSSITAAGITITFETLADLAQFAGTDAKTVLGWVGGATGVSWRAVG